jgi:hypothetical protein
MKAISCALLLGMPVQLPAYSHNLRDEGKRQALVNWTEELRQKTK